MRYWLDLFTPHTWSQFQLHGSAVTGFRARQRRAAFERISEGDVFLCYLVKLSRWCGALQATSKAFESAEPIFYAADDPFVIRFNVSPIVELDFETSIPIDTPELWNALTFTRDIEPGSMGWAQAAKLRQSLIEISADDGSVLLDAIRKQGASRKPYPLDQHDQRAIRDRSVVQTEHGEVEVEVPPKADDPASQDATSDARLSHKMQAKIVQLGMLLGFDIWIPPADRARVVVHLPPGSEARLAPRLPLNYDPVTLRTIENIDVLWLHRRSIAHAFEIEHTTAIYSGLLRMADLLAMQPRIDISLHIVAPPERRDNVRREILRPVFSVLEGGAMSARCSYLSYDNVIDILGQPNIAHMRETILDDYVEYFDEN